MALPRARHSEFSLADLAKAEEALCTATPWTELHLDTLHRAGHSPASALKASSTL